MKFVLFGRLKKNPAPEEEKSKPAPQQAKKITAEERVASLVSQGLAEPDIIKTLKDEGYSFQEIDSSISSVLKSSISNAPTIQSQNEVSGMPDDLAPILGAEENLRDSPQQLRAELTEQMDAVMEQMMEEKISGIISQLDRIDTKFEELENKIQQLVAKISEDETVERKSDEKSESEIQEIDSKEANVEPRVASLEKAFKDIIPGLVESIREMKEAMSSKRAGPKMPESEGEEIISNDEPMPAKHADSNIFD